MGKPEINTLNSHIHHIHILCGRLYCLLQDRMLFVVLKQMLFHVFIQFSLLKK